MNNNNGNFIQAFYNWYRSAIRHPVWGWVIGLATIGYLVSPFDISPDFIPVIGWIDDGILATLLITEVSSIAMAYLKKSSTGDVAGGTVDTEDANVIDVEVS